MRRIAMFVIIVISVVAFIVLAVIMSNPLRWPDSRIRANMLKHTPIGTNIVDVIKFVESNENWKIYHIYQNGYMLKDGIISRPSKQNEYSVGVTSMEVRLGEYRTIFATDVSIFFAFDEDSKLIDIGVLKENDVL